MPKLPEPMAHDHESAGNPRLAKYGSHFVWPGRRTHRPFFFLVTAWRFSCLRYIPRPTGLLPLPLSFLEAPMVVAYVLIAFLFMRLCCLHFPVFPIFPTYTQGRRSPFFFFYKTCHLFQEHGYPILFSLHRRVTHTQRPVYSR